MEWKRAKCHQCRDHLIDEREVVTAIEIGLRYFDHETEPSLSIWKWIDKNGHYGYAGEPNSGNKLYMKRRK